MGAFELFPNRLGEKAILIDEGLGEQGCLRRKVVEDQGRAGSDVVGYVCDACLTQPAFGYSCAGSGENVLASTLGKRRSRAHADDIGTMMRLVATRVTPPVR
jgi:hypothetical protein